jgi:hypothetical protein
MTTPESVKDYLYRRLKEVGAGRFDAIAQETGVALSFIRKFVYGSRENPRIDTIQPLLHFFSDVDSGKRSLADLDKAA